MGLVKLFEAGIAMPEQNARELQAALQNGLKFFQHFNETRLQLALEAFSEEMKLALYEVLYLLHVNTPALKDIKCKATKVQRISGIVRETEYQASFDLYLPEAPCGVIGMHRLPAPFRESFRAYLAKEFKETAVLEAIPSQAPIVSISTLGSIGTIGHKKVDSDLDLQILYDLQPFKIKLDEWDDARLKEALERDIESWIDRLCIQRKIVPLFVHRNPTVYKELQQKAILRVAKNYPYLYQILYQNKDFNAVMASAKGRQLKMTLIHEMMQLIQGDYKLTHREEISKAEELLKQRVAKVEEYVQAKFPHAELHLFICDVESFRQGKHGTTLESKEASGSAYELILNYEVLIPGIQVTAAIPTHFVISPQFNNSLPFYERIVQYIRFQCLPFYRDVEDQLMDMGPTPTLKLSYMLSHIGAAYWESFKAASGNLAKALLNLFRVEVMYHSPYLLTLIELIKLPQALDSLIAEVPLAPQHSGKSRWSEGLSLSQVLDLEKTFPTLQLDPWWLKYKVLKVFYHDPEVALDASERRRILRLIDLCFALHIKLSEAFHLPPDFRQVTAYREKFLIEFLRLGFPKNSPQRQQLEHIFMGEVQTVNRFERDMKDLFSNCLERIHRLVAFHDIPDGSNQAEFEIWFHYYQQNFETGPAQVSKNILAHLKVPRQIIRIRYEKSRRRGNWVFRASSAKEQTHGVETIQGAPGEVILTYEISFLRGLSYCVLNGYYGLLRAGSLRETKTKMMIDIGSTDLGNAIDNHWSIIDSEMATRLADRIVNFFPYRKVHYMDCVRVKRKITEAIFFINLFKFGRLSILSRDNRQNWFVVEYDHPELVLNAQECYDSIHRVLQHPSLHQSIDRFLQENQINMTDKQLKFSFWYNLMSTAHSQALDPASREKNLVGQFQDAFMREHGGKMYAPPPLTEPPVAVPPA